VSESSEIEARVREVLREHAQLRIPTADLGAEASLYEAGMTSRASVSVMLALEGEFEVEFPDEMLRREVFESIRAIGKALLELTGGP
jgi:acyl carrier protein